MRKLVKYKKVEYELAQFIWEVEACVKDPEYQRDLEFDRQLTALMEKFGYNAEKVCAMLTELRDLKRPEVAKLSPDVKKLIATAVRT